MTTTKTVKDANGLLIYNCNCGCLQFHNLNSYYCGSPYIKDEFKCPSCGQKFNISSRGIFKDSALLLSITDKLNNKVSGWNAGQIMSDISHNPIRRDYNIYNTQNQ